MHSEQRNVIYITAISHALCHAFMLVFPIVLVVLKLEYNLTFLEVGTLGMIAYICFGVGAVPAGLLIDKVGPKNMIR